MDNKIYAAIDNRKVAIIGSGYVGASIAYALTIRDLASEIVLVDSDSRKATGEALDIQHGIPYMGTSAVRAGDYSDCKNCDLIIITAGRNRRVGEDRLDMISDNIGTIRDVVENIRPYYTHGVILMVSNPVDILTYKCAQWMDLPNGKVFGTGCILDTSRLVRSIANYTNLNIEAIKCNIVGEHGMSQFPVWSRLSIAGIPMNEYCSNVGLPWGEEERDRIYNQVKNMGAEIIADKGKTHYGIATCVCSLADAVLNQRLTVAPVSSPLQGEYGIENVSLSIPSIVGVNGVEHRLEEKWTNEEIGRLRESADKLKRALNEYK
ncbi:MAG: L-lactate dehydrogenase [Clostridiales bacterium]|nr:L-lactate dehydrogenase [Clostridiales bacterium]MDD7036240.1 L-lactate dehydrogenase [Bacillota bacterium]MDY2920903.1 L-lactate dehydrogenase [Lentihominibacter sp.]